MFRSLWFKLVGALVLVLIITLIIVLGIIIRITEQELRQYTQARTEFASSLLPTVPPPIPISPDLTITPIPTIPSMDVRSSDGIRPEVRITIGPETNSTRIMQPGELRPFLSDLVRQAAEGGLTGAQFLADVRRTAGISIALAGIAAILLGTLIFRQITRPLANLRTAVQSFASGDLSVRIPVKTNDEVGKVTTAFNHMASQIERQEHLRQRMVADVAHELRTPLSVIQSNLEAMMDGLLAPDNNELEELHEEVRRLTRMIEELRLLSMADAGQLKLEKSSFDVGKLIMKVVDLMNPLADAHSVRLHTILPLSPIIIRADEDRLQQALTNLIDNGVRHTPPGGQVTTSVAYTSQATFITVSDNGTGIPTEELPNIFERFWRGDKSRSRNSGGSGLGLSIVKQIAELHGGAVQVVSPESGGSQFTITIPAD